MSSLIDKRNTSLWTPLDTSGHIWTMAPLCPPPNLQRLLLQHLAEHLPRARVLKPVSMQLYSLADTAENRETNENSESYEHITRVMKSVSSKHLH